MFICQENVVLCDLSLLEANELCDTYNREEVDYCTMYFVEEDK